MLGVCLTSIVVCLKKPSYDLTVVREVGGDYWHVRNKTECMYYHRAVAVGNTCRCPASFPNFYGVSLGMYGCYKDDEIMSGKAFDLTTHDVCVIKACLHLMYTTH